MIQFHLVLEDNPLMQGKRRHKAAAVGRFFPLSRITAGEHRSGRPPKPLAALTTLPGPPRQKT